MGGARFERAELERIAAERPGGVIARWWAAQDLTPNERPGVAGRQPGDTGRRSGRVEVTFIQPCWPWSTNTTSGHWSTTSKRTKLWRAAACEAARGVAPRGRTLVTVHLGFETNRRRDPHNWVAGPVKAAVDGLVDAGVWPDDTTEWVEVAEPRLVAPAGDVCRIVLTDAENPQT